MTQDDLIYVGLTRERAEALIEAARYAVGNPDFASVQADDMEPVTLGADDLRAALDQPAPERVEEYRVTYFHAATAPFPTLKEARAAQARFTDQIPTAIQSRTVIRTPWKDLEEAEDE